MLLVPFKKGKVPPKAILNFNFDNRDFKLWGGLIGLLLR